MKQLIKEYGIDVKIEEAVYEGKYTLEELGNYCRNLGVNLKSMYFNGLTWNELDLFRGDLSELIPYITPHIINKANQTSLSYEQIINSLTRNQLFRDKIYGYLYEINNKGVRI